MSPNLAIPHSAAPPLRVPRMTMTMTAQAESLLCGSALGTVRSALCTLRSVLTTTSEVGAALCLDTEGWELRLRVVRSHAEVTQPVHTESEFTLGQPEPSTGSDPLPCLLSAMFRMWPSLREDKGGALSPPPPQSLARAWHKAAHVLICE